MSDPKLSKEEKQILKDFEAGELNQYLRQNVRKCCKLLLKKHLKKTNE